MPSVPSGKSNDAQARTPVQFVYGATDGALGSSTVATNVDPSARQHRAPPRRSHHAPGREADRAARRGHLVHRGRRVLPADPGQPLPPPAGRTLRPRCCVHRPAQGRRRDPPQAQGRAPTAALCAGARRHRAVPGPQPRPRNAGVTGSGTAGALPGSEPFVRFSRIRLSSRWLHRDRLARRHDCAERDGEFRGPGAYPEP